MDDKTKVAPIVYMRDILHDVKRQQQQDNASCPSCWYMHDACYTMLGLCSFSHTFGNSHKSAHFTLASIKAAVEKK